ncbi:MAG: glycosyltransferase family 1 protein [Patescibacteria group bacterium]|jgi:glycosyltransferase involved in cell wall biosynthesis
MKILIDARMYGPRGSKGLGRYIKEIIDGLVRQDSQNEYVILLQRENWDDFAEKPGFHKVLAPWRWYTLAEQIYLPRLIKKEKPDLVHFPHFNVPLFYFFSPFVVTIHDLLLRQYPSRRASTLGPIKYWLKNIGYRLIVWAAVWRAKKIITISDFTKTEILKYYPLVDRNKIEVVYEGVSKLEKEMIEKKDDNDVLLRYNITDPFILYVGSAYPHKNLDKLILAFARPEKNWTGKLVLVGKKDYFYQRLEEGVQELNTKSVLFLGYIPDSDLAVLYRQARVYVFPSLYEGFGLPPLEAMSWGLPVVASDIPSLREVIGDAYEKFNPKSVSDILQKIKNVLTDNVKQEKLRYLGLEQIKKYNWDATVKKHIDIYHAAKK